MDPTLTFDPTNGYDLNELLRIEAPPPPDDYETFWLDTYEAALDVLPRPVRRPSYSPSAHHDMFELEYDGLDGFRVGGWLLLPSDGEVTCGFVCGHGYGGREQPDYGLPVPGAAAVFPCARGFGRSARPELPADANHHVLHGITARETYLHRFCVADLWCAASALLELVPEAAPRLYYSGGSFGGGLGAMTLPWDDRFRKGFLAVPSFGNHAVRLTLPCTGSGEAVRQYHAEHPEVVEVLAYYDAATAARFVLQPTLVAAAKLDPAVPPPGQFAVYNGLAGRRGLFVLTAGHTPYPGEADEGRSLWHRQQTWFGQD